MTSAVLDWFDDGVEVGQLCPAWSDWRGGHAEGLDARKPFAE